MGMKYKLKIKLFEFIEWNEKIDYKNALHGVKIKSDIENKILFGDKANEANIMATNYEIALETKRNYIQQEHIINYHLINDQISYNINENIKNENINNINQTNINISGQSIVKGEGNETSKSTKSKACNEMISSKCFNFFVLPMFVYTSVLACNLVHLIICEYPK